MAYLHSDREQFRDAIDLAYEQTGVMVQAIEKDYYVTMLLRLLAQRMPYIVFKGGTSLSKCHKVIRRFSEDIDITIDTLLSQGQKKKIKQAIVESAEELGMTIENLDETRSRRDYNRYVIAYDSVIPMASDALKAAVLLETSYTAVSFPTVLLPVHSYIGDMMEQEAPDAIEEYNLILLVNFSSWELCHPWNCVSRIERLLRIWQFHPDVQNGTSSCCPPAKILCM